MRPASRERRNFASGKRKRFWRVSGGGGKGRAQFWATIRAGNRRQLRGYATAEARVRIRRQPLTYLRNNGQRSEDEEARFAAGLKVPRCVTRLLGAELMPPSE